MISRRKFVRLGGITALGAVALTEGATARDVSQLQGLAFASEYIRAPIQAAQAEP